MNNENRKMEASGTSSDAKKMRNDEFEAEEISDDVPRVQYIPQQEGLGAVQEELPAAPDAEALIHSFHRSIQAGSESGEDSESEAPPNSPGSAMPTAHYVRPINALEVGVGGTTEMEDRLERLELLSSDKRMRFQACTFATLGFSLGVAIAAFILVFLVLPRVLDEETNPPSTLDSLRPSMSAPSVAPSRPPLISPAAMLNPPMQAPPSAQPVPSPTSQPQPPNPIEPSPTLRPTPLILTNRHTKTPLPGKSMRPRPKHPKTSPPAKMPNQAPVPSPKTR